MSCFLWVACDPKVKSPDPHDPHESDSLFAGTSILESLAAGDWFTAQCELLCDPEHGKNLDLEKLRKHGQYNPYDIRQVVGEDSVIVSFDFIANCCLDFVGGVQVRNDTLVLEYRPPHDSLVYGCDCSCDYRMTYRIDKTDLAWTALKTDYRVRL